MQTNRPDIWKEILLGNVLTLEYGKALDEGERVPDGKYPAYGANGIKCRCNKYLSDTPSIIIGRKGSAGEINYSENKFWVLDVAYYVKFDKSKLDIRFLFYLLKNKNLPSLAKGVKPGINRNDVYSIKVKIPPLSEQERIVQILDEVFENIEKAKQNTLQNLNNAKELFESFANMILFKNNDFYTTTIGDSCNLATGGTPDTKNQEYYQNGNIKWLVSGDIHQAEIFDCQGRITEKGLNNSNAKYLPINSVLIALNGQGKTRGTVAILRTKATCNQSLVSINPKNSKFLSTEYLYQNLRARYIEIRKMTGDSGNDRRGLNMGLIRSIQINVPKTLNEQLIIAKKLSNLQLLLKQLEQTYNQKLKSLEELKQSILQKAFNGEL